MVCRPRFLARQAVRGDVERRDRAVAGVERQRGRLATTPRAGVPAVRVAVRALRPARAGRGGGIARLRRRVCVCAHPRSQRVVVAQPAQDRRMDGLRVEWPFAGRGSHAGMGRLVPAPLRLAATRNSTWNTTSRSTLPESGWAPRRQSYRLPSPRARACTDGEARVEQRRRKSRGVYCFVPFVAVTSRWRSFISAVCRRDQAAPRTRTRFPGDVSSSGRPWPGRAGRSARFRKRHRGCAGALRW